MRSFFLYAAVSVSGASVLAVEIVGVRVLGPFYGVGLSLWSSLVTVTLVALSVGYAVGGRWADRGGNYRRLSFLLIAAGLWVLLTPVISRPVLVVSEPLGLRAAVLSSTTVLFAPPLALLGMVGPHAIRLKVSAVDVVGRTAGDLYAMSTVAGVIAALATGFFLIPHAGVKNLLLVVGALLVVTGVGGLLLAARSGRTVGAASLALVAGSLLSWAADAGTERPAGLLAVRHSAYAELRVVDDRGLRMLLLDGGVRSVVDTGTWESRQPHANVFGLARLFFERPGRMLLVGLGGGSVAKQYAASGWAVDAVEIDPAVAELAREYFRLAPGDANVHHTDGRAYMASAGPASWDVIVMDALGSGSIPFHLITREVFELAKSRLSERGILAINVEAIGWRDRIVLSVAATLKTVFATVYVLPTMEPPNVIGNVVIFASDSPLELGYELPPPPSRLDAEYDRVHAWDNRFVADATNAPILTDDQNPVDVWADRINLAARKNVRDYFRDTGLGW